MSTTATDHDEFADVFDDEDESGHVDQYLLFKLGAELYGVPITHVTEIIEMQPITSVPDMPVFIKGVINLRGNVVPVMDLRLRFNMEERPYDDRNCIIIARIGTTSMGFIIDTVAEVHDIPQSNIEPAPDFEDGTGKRHYIAGLGKVGDDVTILIDVKKILAKSDLNTIEEGVSEIAQ